MNNEKQFYTPKEAAAMLSVHYNSIYNMLNDGRLSYYQVGRQKRIPAEQINALAVNKAEPIKEQLRAELQSMTEDELRQMVDYMQQIKKGAAHE